MLLNFKHLHQVGRGDGAESENKQTNKPTKTNHPPKNPNSHLEENGRRVGVEETFGVNIESRGGGFIVWEVRAL